jgi:hypothetical protein
LPSDMLVYLDGQPIIQSIFQGIPISSCSTTRQIQTAACYDVLTFTTTRCTTIGSTAAASAVNLTQCVTTTDTVTRPRFVNSRGSRGGIGGVRRVSAQLLTYITGEPVYASTTHGQTTVTSIDLPLSEARIGAMPASTWDASNRLPVETQGVSTTDTSTPVAATTGDIDSAAQSSVLRQILLDSGLQDLQDGSRATITEHDLGSPTLPTTLPQVEHVDVLKIMLAVGSVASEPQLAHPTPQVTVSQARNTEFSEFESANAGDAKVEGTKDLQTPTGTQNAYSGVPPSSAVSPVLRPPQESDHDTSVYLDIAMAADSALKSPGIQGPSPTAPEPPRTALQTHTLLTPGSTLSFKSARLSVLPDASGLTLSDGSTVRLKDGQAADIRLPDGDAVEISRSGSMYLVATRSGASMPLPNGASTEGLSVPARTTEQITSDGSILSHSVAQASIGVAMDCTTSGVAAEVFAGAASVCSRGVRSHLVGIFVALVWLVDAWCGW